MADRSIYTSMGAVMSACGTYRYTLSRTWDVGPALVVIGLNPSTADHQQDDPTIRRCVGFAKREGLNALVMLNLFAVRATDPRDMKGVDNPIGDNDQTLAGLASKDDGNVWLAAWGAHGTYRNRAADVVRLVTPYVTLHCLGITNAGQPRHPLYLKADTPLMRYADQHPWPAPSAAQSARNGGGEHP